MTRRLVIVRHGNTFLPDEPARRIGWRTDLSLVPSGIVQGETLGRFFHRAGMRFVQAFAGPLVRTRQTASLILSSTANPPPISISEWLAEIDHGPDEGLLETDVRARLGQAVLMAWEEHGTPPPGWNIEREARLEAWRAFGRTVSVGDTLVVTSKGAALFSLLALLDEPSGQPMKLRTGAFGVLRAESNRFDPNTQRWQLESWDIRPEP